MKLSQQIRQTLAEQFDPPGRLVTEPAFISMVEESFWKFKYIINWKSSSYGETVLKIMSGHRERVYKDLRTILNEVFQSVVETYFHLGVSLSYRLTFHGRPVILHVDYLPSSVAGSCGLRLFFSYR